jgi:hypothetical protein
MQNPSKLRLNCVLVAWLAIASAPVLCAQNVQRWIHPGYGEPGAGQLDSPSFQDESQYPTALSQSDVFQFFSGDVANLGYLDNGSGRPGLAARIQIFKKHGTRISIEGGGPNEQEGDAWNPTYPTKRYCELQPGICTPESLDDLAQESAGKTLWKIQPIYDAGGTVSFMAMEGAGIAAILQNGFGPGKDGGAQFSLAQAIDTLVRYMQYVHNGVDGLPGRPEIKFGFNMAMPNVLYQGIPAIHENNLDGLDFYDVLNTIVNTVKQNGEALWFIHSDSPYTYTFGYGYDYLGRLLALRDQARGLGLRYGAIFNTDCGGDVCYTDQTLSYIQQYRSRSPNDDPDDFIIESWYANPLRTFPESTEYTFMNLVKKVSDPNLPATFWGYDHRFSRQLDADIFDWQGYLNHNPDIANFVTGTFGNQQRFGAEWHWLNFGVNEGRRGSGRFSATYYLNRYSDIAAAYGSQNYAGAIDHYLYAGRNEGRYGTDPNCPESSWGCGGY